MVYRLKKQTLINSSASKIGLTNSALLFIPLMIFSTAIPLLFPTIAVKNALLLLLLIMVLVRKCVGNLFESVLWVI